MCWCGWPSVYEFPVVVRQQLDEFCYKEVNGPIQGKSTATDTIKGQEVNGPMHGQSTATARITMDEG